MRRIQSNAASLLLLLVSSVFFSFSAGNGGDSFEIRLNGKKVLQEYVYAAKGVRTIELIQTSANDKLDVYYSHCGHIAKTRYITMRDEQQRPLKVWKFIGLENEGVMSLPLKDVLGLKKSSKSQLALFYSSDELPGGRTLAMVAGDSNGFAKK